MQVTAVFYGFSGQRFGEQDFKNLEDAFLTLQRVGLDAHVFPTGSTAGVYNWQRDREHDFGGFCAKLAQCA